MAFEELTSRHAVMWGSAPFENIADLISDMHLALVERLAPHAGEHWLDLACGAGDVAFHAARAGAIVTGSDLSPTLVETAQRRAEEHGLDLTLEVADCQNLHYADASFDVVSSSVGVIFAPDHERVASELARVCRPGRTRRPDCLAQGERRRRDVRRHDAVHARTAARRRVAVPVGRRGVRRVDARRRVRALVRGARHAARGRPRRRDVGDLPRQLRAVVHALDVARRRAPGRARRGDGGVLRGATARTTGSASSGATSSSPGFASKELSRAATRAAGSRGPRRSSRRGARHRLRGACCAAATRASRRCA